MSASIRSVPAPRFASMVAMFTEEALLPTPPFPEMTLMTRFLKPIARLRIRALESKCIYTRMRKMTPGPHRSGRRLSSSMSCKLLQVVQPLLAEPRGAQPGAHELHAEEEKHDYRKSAASSTRSVPAQPRNCSLMGGANRSLFPRLET